MKNQLTTIELAPDAVMFVSWRGPTIGRGYCVNPAYLNEPAQARTVDRQSTQQLPLTIYLAERYLEAATGVGRLSELEAHLIILSCATCRNAIRDIPHTFARWFALLAVGAHTDPGPNEHLFYLRWSDIFVTTTIARFTRAGWPESLFDFRGDLRDPRRPRRTRST
jgi:hypothetical protein